MSKLIFVEELPKVLDKNYIYIITSGPITKKYSSSKFIYHYTEFNKGFKNPNYFNKNLFFLQEFVDQKFDGKSIKELLIYKNFSLWYFFEYMLFYETLETEAMTSVGRVLYDIDCYSNALEKLNPSEVILDMSNSKSNLILDICTNKKIKTQISGLYKNNSLFKKENFLDVFLYGKFTLRFLIGKYLNLGKKIKFDKNTNLYLSSERFYTGKNISLYPYYDNLNIKNLIYDRVWLLNFDLIKRMLKIKKDENSFYIGQFMNFSDIQKVLKLRNYIKSKYKKYLRNIFEKNLIYNGVNVFKFSSEKFDFTFNNFSLFISEILITLNNLYSNNNFESIFIEQEENFYGKASIVLNKNNLANIIAPQTELIYEHGCLHRHYSNEIIKNKKLDIWRPLPDIKLVSGSYTKNVLINHCNYLDSQIKIVGIPKFENLENKTFNKKKLLEKYNLNNNFEKIICFAGGGVKADKEKIEELIKLVNSYSGKYYLIIKAHPSSNISLLNSIVEEVGPKYVKILLFDDIDEIIFLSDLFISVHSTVIINAYLLNKPVLLINEFEEFMPYADFTEVLVVKELKDLKKYFEYALTKKYKNNVVKTYSNFIEKYLGGNKNTSKNIKDVIFKK